MAVNNNEIYTEEEQESLRFTQGKRLLIVNKLMENDVPTKVGEVRVINELLNSIDSATMEGAKTRIKAKEATNGKAAVAMVTETLKALSRQRALLPKQHSSAIELQDEHVPDDIVYGELDIHPDRLLIEEFVDAEEIR
jgi:hypothetical protein